MEIKDAMVSVQEQLKESRADVRWESEEKLHATIKFLGDVQENVLPSVLSIIKKSIVKFPHFLLNYQGIGCFPNMRNPNVIWIGCHNADGTLEQIKNTLDDELEVFGFVKEKRNFSPHITLGRVKGPSRLRDLTSLIEKVTFEPKGAIVKTVTVLRSKLKPQGSEYSILDEVPLQQP